MGAAIFSGSDVKLLKNNLNLADTVSILTGSLDPSASAVSAPKGSLYISTTSGYAFRKTDAGSSTNWTNIGRVSQGVTAVVSKSADYTLTTSDDVVEYDISGGNKTLTLYSASGNSGRVVRIRIATAGSTNTLTVTDGSFSTKMSTADETLSLYSNGTAWKILSRRIPRTMATTTTTWGVGVKGGIVTDRITYWREKRFMCGTIDYGQNSGGTAGSGTYTLLVPGSWSIDTTNYTSTSTGSGLGTVVGKGVIGNDTVGLGTSFISSLHIYDTTHWVIRKMNNAQASVVNWANTDASVAFNSAQTYVTIDFKIPITNWSY